jgi:catabolite regulation protein CreA
MIVTFLTDAIKFGDSLVTKSTKRVKPFDCERNSLKKLANLFEQVQKGSDKDDVSFANSIKPLFKFISQRWQNPPRYQKRILTCENLKLEELGLTQK